MYITDDGKTRIYITLQEGRTSPMLGVCPNGTVTVDWGDGTEPDVLTGTSTSSDKWTPTHRYASAGDYVISLSVDGEMGFTGNIDNDSGILRYTSGSDTRNRVYQNCVKKIEIGENAMFASYGTFSKCRKLESITIPKGVSDLGTSSFYSCTTLRCIVVPNGVISCGTGVFSSCSKLEYITIPNGFYVIWGSLFKYDYFLKGITIPKSVEAIKKDAFGNCHDIRYFNFSGFVSVPPLESTTAFADIPADCQMLIPSALFDKWRAATNWTALAKYMVAV
jgi:hypothetical protein